MRKYIPIYRAKKIDSDEWVEGYLVGCYIFTSLTVPQYENKSCNGQQLKISEASMVHIDTNTLAIHRDKKDKNSKQVFFSLSKDGKGGDLVAYGSGTYYAVWNIKNDKLEFVSADDELQRLNTMANVEVIGIHKG